jgi:hypothetical protein
MNVILIGVFTRIFDFREVLSAAGGLAAPAIAAGIGAAIGLAGGSAVGLTGFLATTAGGAVVASAVGAAGSGLAAPHIAHRIGAFRSPNLSNFWYHRFRRCDPLLRATLPPQCMRCPCIEGKRQWGLRYYAEGGVLGYFYGDGKALPPSI